MGLRFEEKEVLYARMDKAAAAAVLTASGARQSKTMFDTTAVEAFDAHTPDQDPIPTSGDGAILAALIKAGASRKIFMTYEGRSRVWGIRRGDGTPRNLPVGDQVRLKVYRTSAKLSVSGAASFAVNGVGLLCDGLPEYYLFAADNETKVWVVTKTQLREYFKLMQKGRLPKEDGFYAAKDEYGNLIGIRVVMSWDIDQYKLKSLKQFGL